MSYTNDTDGRRGVQHQVADYTDYCNECGNYVPSLDDITGWCAPCSGYRYCNSCLVGIVRAKDRHTTLCSKCKENTNGAFQRQCIWCGRIVVNTHVRKGFCRKNACMKVKHIVERRMKQGETFEQALNFCKQEEVSSRIHV